MFPSQRRTRAVIRHLFPFTVLHACADAPRRRFRRDLLEAPTAEDMDEMRAATLAALEAVDGPGWQLVTAGGAARGLPSHDADFLVTHSTDPVR